MRRAAGTWAWAGVWRVLVPNANLTAPDRRRAPPRSGVRKRLPAALAPRWTRGKFSRLRGNCPARPVSEPSGVRRQDKMRALPVARPLEFKKRVRMREDAPVELPARRLPPLALPVFSYW